MTTIVTRAGKGSPLTNNEVDENFVNLNTAKIETLTSTDSSVTITGTGDSRNLSVPVNPNVVSGPASATDNAVARFDTTTGKLIQNSTVTLDDNGNVESVNAVAFDTTPGTLPTTPGSLYWDSADGNQTLSLVMANGDAIQQIGEEMYFRIKASAPIAEGQVVMFTGTVGASGGLTGAPATGLTAATASYVMGIATHSLATNDWGYITNFGLVRNLNTNAWPAGTILYYDPTVAGGLTDTIPTAPNAKVQVCAVVYQSESNGSLFIRPSFGGILGQYEGDVGFTSVAAGNLLRRNADNTAWENVATIPNSNLENSSITINGSAISLGGSATVGTVTSVTGTAPIASSGGATPAISITQASASTSGYLSSTDWNAFNGKLSISGSSDPTISNTAPTISLTDTDQGVTKKIHHNSGLIGFLGDSSQWIQYTNNSGQINTPAYGWLHDYFVSGVSNCLRSYRISSPDGGNTGNCAPAQMGITNCYGGGNVSVEQIEVSDNGSTIGIKSVNYFFNCNCNCQCNC